MISPALTSELRAILKKEFDVAVSEAEAAEIGMAWTNYFEQLHILNYENRLTSNEHESPTHEQGN